MSNVVPEEFCGLYCIRNLINNKRYIGQTINYKARWALHVSRLKLGKHDSTHLQNSYNKYGINNFDFSMLEYCDENSLTKREQFWMDEYKTLNPVYGYNTREAGNSGKYNEESRTRMSLRSMGKNNPNFGKHLSDEAKDRIRVANKGITHNSPKIELRKEKQRGAGHPRFGKKLKNADSKYVGVSFLKNIGKWKAMVIYNKKRFYLGVFVEEIDAAKTVDSFVVSNSFPHPLNFPNSRGEIK